MQILKEGEYEIKKLFINPGNLLIVNFRKFLAIALASWKFN